MFTLFSYVKDLGVGVSSWSKMKNAKTNLLQSNDSNCRFTRHYQSQLINVGDKESIFVCLSVCLSLCLCLFLSLYLSLFSLFLYLCFYFLFSVCLSVSMYLYVSPFFWLSVCLYVSFCLYGMSPFFFFVKNYFVYIFFSGLKKKRS